jgi:hypothetical protein
MLARNVPWVSLALRKALIDKHVGHVTPAFRKQSFAFATILPNI